MNCVISKACQRLLMRVFTHRRPEVIPCHIASCRVHPWHRVKDSVSRHVWYCLIQSYVLCIVDVRAYSPVVSRFGQVALPAPTAEQQNNVDRTPFIALPASCMDSVSVAHASVVSNRITSSLVVAAFRREIRLRVVLCVRSCCVHPIHCQCAKDVSTDRPRWQGTKRSTGKSHRQEPPCPVFAASM